MAVDAPEHSAYIYWVDAGGAMFARQMRIVRFRRVGKCAYYTLDDEHIRRLLTEGFRHVNERA